MSANAERWVCARSRRLSRFIHLSGRAALSVLRSPSLEKEAFKTGIMRGSYTLRNAQERPGRTLSPVFYFSLFAPLYVTLPRVFAGTEYRVCCTRAAGLTDG